MRPRVAPPAARMRPSTARSAARSYRASGKEGEGSCVASLGPSEEGKGAALRAWQQQPAHANPLNGVFTPIRMDIGYFTGRGGTIGYLINKDGVLVVDSQYMDSAKICIAGLQARSKNRGADWDVLICQLSGDHSRRLSGVPR